MRRLSAIMSGLLVIAFAAFGCAQMSSLYDSATGWTTLIDGEKGLENFNRVGNANWRAEDGVIVADHSTINSYLVSKKSFTNFQLRAEFWADHTTNSGIHFRLIDPKKIDATTSYEANIFDRGSRPEFGTGAIMGFAKVKPIYKAGGKWNTYVITAKDNHLQVNLNGVETVSLYDSKFPSGLIALQFGVLSKGVPGGIIKWRKVQIKEL